MRHIFNFWERLSFLERKLPSETIGTSWGGREIKAFGKSDAKMVIIGGIHAREVASVELALRICETFACENVLPSVAVIPLLNPDGLKIVECGRKGLEMRYARFFEHYDRFDNWKANGKGVDLNVNFDADWGKGEKNVFIAGAENYVGEYVFSEPETVAIRDFLNKIKPREVWALHSRGEVVYYGFKNNCPLKDAEKVGALFGFPGALSSGSAGGLKDWYSIEHSADGFAVTVELGADGAGYRQIAEDDKYMEKLKNRVYGYLISQYYDG